MSPAMAIEKTMCNKKCDERKKSLTCLNDKDKWNNNCDERKKSVSSQSSGDKDKSNKNSDERKKNLSKSPKCSTGDIKNSKKDSEQRKIDSPTNKENREELKTKTKEVGIQKDSSSSSSQTPRDNEGRSKSPDRKKQNDFTASSRRKNIGERDKNWSKKFINNMLYYIPTIMVYVLHGVNNFAYFNAVNMNSLILYVLRVTECFVLLLSPAFCAGMLPTEVEKIKTILHGKLLEVHDTSEIQDIKRFINYVQERGCRFHVYHLFPLNADLLGMVLGFCVTYLIVIIQFTKD